MAELNVGAQCPPYDLEKASVSVPDFVEAVRKKKDGLGREIEVLRLDRRIELRNQLQERLKELYGRVGSLPGGVEDRRGVEDRIATVDAANFRRKPIAGLRRFRYISRLRICQTVTCGCSR